MLYEENTPTDLVFIRHGESEENAAQDTPTLDIAAIYNRANWKQRLTSAGIEEAVTTREWLLREVGSLAAFGGLYVSPYLRARETAAIISQGTSCAWTIDDVIGEREWGVYGETPSTHRAALFPATEDSLQKSRFWTRPCGGENVPDVHNRVDRFLAIMAQRHAGQRVLIVTHGGFMRAVRYNLEHMRPEEYEAAAADPEQEIINGTILWYSRSNPQDYTDSRPNMIWRRIIHPNSGEQSAQAVGLSQSRAYNSEELHAQLEIAQPITDTY